MPLLSDATALHVGATPAQKAYLGDTEVWSAGPFTPAKVNGLVFWLDATTTAPGPVAVWEDKGPSGLDARQPVVAQRPVSMIASDGSGTVVDFPSTFSNFMDIPGLGALLEGLEEHTIILRFFPRTYGQYPIFMTAPSTSTWTWLLELNSPLGWYWGSGGNQHYRYYNSVPPMKVWWTVSHVYGQSIKSFFNGIETLHYMIGANGDVSPPSNLGPDVRLGAYFDQGLRWDGHISDILIYDRALSDDERQQIESYIGVGRGYANPKYLPGCVLALDASSLLLLDGEQVTLWPDESPLHHDMVVWEGGATAPTFRTGVQNGHPVVRFTDGNVLSTQVQPPTYKHIFMVARYTNATFGDYNGLLTGHDGNEIVFIGNGPGTTRWYLPPWTGTYRFNGVLDAGTWPAPMATFGLMDLSANSPGWPLARTRIGLDRVYAPRYWHGDVAEVLAYDRVLTEEERLAAEQHLREKWRTP